MFYNEAKGFDRPKVPKIGEEIFLTVEQVDKILRTIEDSNHERKQRDHAAIFLGFHFALRCGETALLERECFRRVGKRVAFIPTLKRGERIPYQCPKCSRRCRVAAVKVGRLHRCSNCMASNPVRKTKERCAVSHEVPLIEVPFMERHVRDYIEHYLENVMRPDQRWLFEGFPGKHVVERTVSNIFSTYARLAGLPAIYSWHALRHGRGVQLWDSFQDLALIQLVLRHKSISSSQIYVHLSPKKREKYLRLLEGEPAVGLKEAAN